MIPTDRPVIGGDLETIRELLGIDVLSACFLFGIAPQKWSSYTCDKGAKEVLSNATQALLVRYYDQYPHRAPVMRYASPADLVESGLKAREVGPLLGREVSRGNSWINGSSNTTPPVDRMCNHLYAEVLPQGEFEEWSEIVAREGRLRGNPDVLKDGRWKVAGSKDSDDD